MEKLVAGVVSWSEAALAVLGLIGMLWIAMKRLYKMARNIEELVSIATSSAARIEAVEKEVKTNGGSSLKDAVHRVEASQAVMNERLSRLEAR